MRSKIEFKDRDVNHKILGYAAPGSQAEYLLLKRRFLMKDEFWFYENNKRGPQLLFNTQFLEGIQKTYKELHCEFCGKAHLRIYKWFENKRIDDMATADHFFPKSHDKEKLSFEIKNLVVACEKCNNKKGSQLWQLDSLRFPYQQTIENLKQIYNGCTTIQRGYADRSRNFTN